VQAEDFHFNGSKFSKIVELIKPDTIKPTCPVFKKVFQTDTSIYLTWYASSSEDVAFHTLYRKAKDSTNFIPIYNANFKSEIFSYSDHSAEPGILYQYYVTATDKSNNQSPPSPSFKAIRLKSDDTEKLKLAAQADRTAKVISLSWKMTKKQVERFLVYKSIEGTAPVYHCTLPGNVSYYADKELEINTNYQYKVIAEYTDGTKKYSDIVKVGF
jgi:hypothetical protein